MLIRAAIIWGMLAIPAIAQDDSALKSAQSLEKALLADQETLPELVNAEAPKPTSRAERFRRIASEFHALGMKAEAREYQLKAEQEKMRSKELGRLTDESIEISRTIIEELKTIQSHAESGFGDPRLLEPVVQQLVATRLKLSKNIDQILSSLKLTNRRSSWASPGLPPPVNDPLGERFE